MTVLSNLVNNTHKTTYNACTSLECNDLYVVIIIMCMSGVLICLILLLYFAV